MYVVYDNSNARGPSCVAFCSVLFFTAPAPWAAPDWGDLAAGGDVEKYPGFSLTLVS